MATNRLMSWLTAGEPGQVATWISGPWAYIAARASGIQFSQQLRPLTLVPANSCARSPWPSPSAHMRRSP